MNNGLKVRQRAVKLTPEALDVLRKTLDERWRASGLTSKLTRQVRAELMGISVPTSDRILERKGVDRASLVQAFKSLEIEWSESFIELQGPIDQPDIENSPDLSAVASDRRKSIFIRIGLVGIVAFLILALLASVANSWKAKKDYIIWTDAFDHELTQAYKNYEKGDYTASETHLASAMNIADRHDASRDLEGALKLRGDISFARGRLTSAVQDYRATISYRQLRNKPIWGPIYEALGSVQIRLKDYKSAEASLDLALQGYTASHEPNGIAEVYRDRGTLAAARRTTDQALQWFAKSLEVLATGQSPDMVIDVRGERAMVYLQLGRYKESHKELEVCLNHWTKLGHPRWIALTEMRLGLAEDKLGKKTEAQTRVSRAKVMFEKVGDEARVKEADHHLKNLMASVQP